MELSSSSSVVITVVSRKWKKCFAENLYHSTMLNYISEYGLLPFLKSFIHGTYL